MLISTAFAAIAKLTVLVTTQADTLSESEAFYQQVAASFAAVIVSIASAALWRAKLGPWVRERLNAAKISIHDGHTTAWQTLIADDSRALSHIVVFLTNGDAYMCNDPARFHHLRTKSSILGEDGSVALYVTHFRANGEDDWVDVSDELTEEKPATITYIPSSGIKMIDTGGAWLFLLCLVNWLALQRIRLSRRRAELSDSRPVVC